MVPRTHKAFTYLFFLKMTVNARHNTANMIPAVARNTYTTVRPNDTVTTSSIGVPSMGVPPAQLYIYIIIGSVTIKNATATNGYIHVPHYVHLMCNQ